MLVMVLLNLNVKSLQCIGTYLSPTQRSELMKPNKAAKQKAYLQCNLWLKPKSLGCISKPDH